MQIGYLILVVWSYNRCVQIGSWCGNINALQRSTSMWCREAPANHTKARTFMVEEDTGHNDERKERNCEENRVT